MPKASRLKDRPKATISDVARLAGVSIGTVSNVLNPRIPVSDARRAAVVAAIDTLGFLPNRVAQSLRRRHSRVVGLIAHDTASAYFAALLDNFESIGAQQGYEVMQVLSRGEPETEVRRARALLERQVDGILLVPTAAPALPSTRSRPPACRLSSSTASATIRASTMFRWTIAAPWPMRLRPSPRPGESA